MALGGSVVGECQAEATGGLRGYDWRSVGAMPVKEV